MKLNKRTLPILPGKCSSYTLKTAYKKSCHHPFLPIHLLLGKQSICLAEHLEKLRFPQCIRSATLTVDPASTASECSHSSSVPSVSTALSALGHALDRLVAVSSMCCHTSTSALSTSSSSRGLTTLRRDISS